jgi:hypothetical protein
MGGLLVSFGDALGGQCLAQPGMLVVHVSLPFLQLRLLVPATWSSVGRRWPAQDGVAADAWNPASAICVALAMPHSWSLPLYGRRFASAGHAG